MEFYAAYRFPKDLRDEAACTEALQHFRTLFEEEYERNDAPPAFLLTFNKLCLPLVTRVVDLQSFFGKTLKLKADATERTVCLIPLINSLIRLSKVEQSVLSTIKEEFKLEGVNNPINDFLMVILRNFGKYGPQVMTRALSKDISGMLHQVNCDGYTLLANWQKDLNPGQERLLLHLRFLLCTSLKSLVTEFIDNEAKKDKDQEQKSKIVAAIADINKEMQTILSNRGENPECDYLLVKAMIQAYLQLSTVLRETDKDKPGYLKEAADVRERIGKAVCAHLTRLDRSGDLLFEQWLASKSEKTKSNLGSKHLILKSVARLISFTISNKTASVAEYLDNLFKLWMQTYFSVPEYSDPTMTYLSRQFLIIASSSETKSIQLKPELRKSIDDRLT
jgi:hypothetical protein